ncbi:MAG: GAF domain-containing protein [Anaerolineales bacterium]|nr:GAF domain-containing protein [Anaerolineales bacterium]
MKTPQDNNEEANGNIQKRLNNLYSKQELPTHVSISEVEAMKIRISELEAELARQPKADEGATFSEIKPEVILPKPSNKKVEPQAVETSWLPSFLTAPVFEDDIEKTRSAQLLHQITMASWGLPILAVVVSILNSTQARFTLPAAFILFVVLTVVTLFNRAGRVKLGSSLIVGTVVLLFSYLNYAGAGEPRPLLLLTVVAIMMSGLLLGSRGPIVVSIILALQHTFIILLSARGLIVAQAGASTPVQNAVVTTVSYLLIGFLLKLAISRIQFVLDELRVDEAELEVKNRELKDFSTSLEQRVVDRTHDLELAAEVGRSITERVGNLAALLSQSAELIRSKFALYYTQIYIVDPSERNLTLRAGTGTAGTELMQRGHRLPISSASLNGRAALDRQAVIVGDTRQSGNFLPNPLLPLTRSELAIPLIANNKVVGVLDMQNDKEETFSAANLPAFQVLAGQLAIAIQNAALFSQAEESRFVLEEQSRRLTRSGWQEFMNAVDLNESIGYVFSQDEIIPLVEAQSPAFEGNLTVPIEVTGANIGEVQLTDEVDRKWTDAEIEIVQATVARAGQHIENLRLLAQADRYRAEAEQVSRRLTREGWDTYVQTRSNLASGYSYNLNEVSSSDQSIENDASLTQTRPITVRDETIGELSINTNDMNHEEVNEIFSAVATQLSDHIENLRLLEQNEKRAYELATVATVSTTASTVLDPDKLLQAVVDLTKERFNMYHTHIYLADESWNTLLLTAGAGEVGRQMVEAGHAIEMDKERSLVARAARERKAIIVNDVRSEADFLPNPMLSETRAEIAVPMIVGDKVLGVFDVQSNITGQFTEEDANIYTTLASQVAVALQNARLYVEQSATVTQLRELDRLKSSFLANMSHELRTPLNSILGFADVMLEELDGPLTENMANDLGLIQKNGQHLLHLINDVLDMAKIESGKMNLNVEKFILQDVFDEVTSITSSLAGEKSLSLVIEPDSDHDVEINADKIRLRQVMINLVNNAMKFTEKGRISIRALRENDQVLVTIKDTGIGIPPEQLESVFQEFTQVDTTTTRKAGGTGLGLPISRRLIQMHSGRLWAESSGINGEGTTFYVQLPIEANINEDVSLLVK